MLKLFHPGVIEIPVALEYAAAGLASDLGVAVARPLARVVEEGRPGIIFERVTGPTMFAEMIRRPYRMWPLIRALARYQVALHAQVPGVVDVIPDMGVVMAHRIALSAAGAEAQARASARLDSLGIENRLCHGDLHPANILLGATGLFAIDWSKAMIGSPAADAARTELLIRFGHGGKSGAPAPMRFARAVTARWYRFCYSRLSGVTDNAIRAWHLPVAVAWYRGQADLRAAGLPDYIDAMAAKQRLN